jgi:dihydrofolate reductase
MSPGIGRRRKSMSRITLQTHVTLDGVIESPPEALLPYMSDEGRQATLDLTLAADALLLGRTTWQGLASAWREQTGPLAERLNSMPKYVVTSTLTSADEWRHSEIIGYGDVAALRERLDLLTYGCGVLARDMLRDGLLDELHLNITPVVAGRGRQLFDEPSELLAFDLLDSRTYPTGAVRLVLRPPATAEEHAYAGDER